jgi:hypothetical protein
MPTPLEGSFDVDCTCEAVCSSLTRLFSQLITINIQNKSRNTNIISKHGDAGINEMESKAVQISDISKLLTPSQLTHKHILPVLDTALKHHR